MTVKPSKLILKATADFAYELLSWIYGNTLAHPQLLWGCRIVWCTLTSWYLVSLLPVSIIHASDIFLVGFWSWGISFIMWGCRGWGWQAAGAGRQPGLGFWFPVKWWDSPPLSGDLESANQNAPSKKPAGELKSPRAPKFEQKPAKFVPIGLLCKHVTNHFVTRM